MKSRMRIPEGEFPKDKSWTVGAESRMPRMMPPGWPDDGRSKQHHPPAHLAYSTQRVSRTTVMRICPG